MKVLLWTHNDDLDQQVSNLVSATGAIIFRAQAPDEIARLARKEQPLLILIGPGRSAPALEQQIEEIASHPDTRWTPTVLLNDDNEATKVYTSLLDRGASSVIDCKQTEKLLQAQFRALHRSSLRLSTLRSTRLTDEKTGFYHQSFLLDQLQVLCRKKRRDGIPFCLLFLELRGEDDVVHKAALNLSKTVRGADLFGRWDSELFAVLLPSSEPKQARLLATRCHAILQEHKMPSRAALVSSDSGVVEAEALIEAAQITLDQGWGGETFLWSWDGHLKEAVATQL